MSLEYSKYFVENLQNANILLTKEIARLKEETDTDTTYDYACGLLKNLAPDVEPADTIFGILTQIDNWSFGAMNEIQLLKEQTDMIMKDKYHRMTVLQSELSDYARSMERANGEIKKYKSLYEMWKGAKGKEAGDE